VPRTVGAAVAELNELMEQADEFWRNEQLLTVAASPLERRFRTWFLIQFTSQAAGADPTHWDGPLSSEAERER
jgi:hypothetical protein